MERVALRRAIRHSRQLALHLCAKDGYAVYNHGSTIIPTPAPSLLPCPTTDHESYRDLVELWWQAFEGRLPDLAAAPPEAGLDASLL